MVVHCYDPSIGSWDLTHTLSIREEPLLLAQLWSFKRPDVVVVDAYFLDPEF